MQSLVKLPKVQPFGLTKRKNCLLTVRIEAISEKKRETLNYVVIILEIETFVVNLILGKPPCTFDTLSKSRARELCCTK